MKSIYHRLVLAALLTLPCISTYSQTSNLGLNFDGVDDRVTIASNTAYNVTNGNFTIEAWVKLNTTQNVNFPTIFSKREATNVNSGVLLMIYGGKVFLQIGGTNIPQGATNIQDNLCHHVAVVRSGTTVYYYVDGNLDGTFSNYGQYINTTHPIWIGHDEPASTTTRFKGMISEVRYWNIVRTQAQIQASKNIFLNGNESGLVGYWRLNDGTGQTVNDYTGANNDGYLGTSTAADASDPVYVTGCYSGCTPPTAVITSGGTNICTGGSLTLSASTGTGYSYQWKLNNANITGATAATYAATTAGTYVCVITANACSATSNSIVLTSGTPVLSISYSPGLTICSGSSKVLTANISANGGTSPSYQWKLGGVNISGATASTYAATQPGTYTVAVTNTQTGCTGTSSNSVVLVVLSASPVITISASSTTACTSVFMTASPNVSGQTYQWQLNNVNITGATQYYYQALSSGNYRCVVTNVCGTANSNTLAITITGTGLITAAGNTTFCSGNVALNAPYVSGATYQWYNSGSLIAGAMSSTYIASVSGNYRCLITTAACGALYTSNYITVTGPANIVATGATTFCTGSVALFAYPNSNATYQWKLNGTNITGATISTYNASATGNYECVVTNTQCGTVTSNAIYVTTGIAPTVSITPGPQVDVCNFLAPPLIALPFTAGTYNWYHYSSAIGGPFLFYVDSTSNELPYYSSFSTDIYVELVTACGTSVSSPVIIRNMEVATIEEGSSSPTCNNPGAHLWVGQPNFGFPFPFWDSYQWRKNGVAIAGATGSDYYATTNGYYSCLISSSCGTMLVNDSANVIVAAPADTTLSLSGPASFCSGSNVTLSLLNQSGVTYKWYKNGSLQSGTSNTFTANSSGTYYCTLQNPCGNKNTRSVVVTVTQTLQNSISASGPATLCSGGSVLLQASTGSGYIYQWNKNNVAIAGATQSTYATSTGGSYSYNVSTSGGCTNMSTSLIVTTGTPAVTITASQVTVCSGQLVSLTYTASNPVTSASWKFNNVAFSSSINSPISYFPSQSGNITITTTNICGSATSSAIPVTVNPLPSASISAVGNTTFCPGGNVVLNATVLSGHTYQWRKDGANISGATTNSYTATATGNYYCVLTNTTTGCSSATSNSIGINATGINATVTPTGTWYKCTGQPVLLTANTGTGLTYQWRSNNINIAGATTSTYTVTTAGNYTVAVTGTCGTSVSAITSVNYTTSLPSGNINTLNTTICSGSTGSMSVYSTLGYSYQWKLNGAAISGAISYLYTTTVAGSYTCTITNACGSYTTPAVVLTTGTLTTATITAGGPVSFCPGGSVVLSSNTGTGYTYQWYNNGALISGATSSSYTATIGGTYACKITSGTCNLTSNLINVTVTGPVAVITPAGSTTICSGTSVTLNTTAGATSYQWKRNNVNLSGATSASFTTSTAGSYTVVVTSSCGSATSAPLVISVINNPTPTITAIGPTTFCAGQSVTFTANTFTGVTYQWQKNSTNISGAVAQSYVANAAGTYRVQETANGCSKYSSTKTVIVNCRLADATANTTEEKNSLGNLNIYPNPNNGYFIVEYSLLNNTESTLVVADITGKIIFNTLLSQGSAKQNISLPFLEEGVYNCVVTQGNVKANKKLVVIKK